MTSVDLPPPETPVTQVKSPSGIVAGDVLQVVAARADDRQLAPGSAARRLAGIATVRSPER